MPAEVDTHLEVSSLLKNWQTSFSSGLEVAVTALLAVNSWDVAVAPAWLLPMIVWQSS
jgi:hypothetical protein